MELKPSLTRLKLLEGKNQSGETENEGIFKYHPNINMLVSRFIVTY